MLDTLKLYIEEYDVAQGSNLTIQPATYNAGSGEVVGEHRLFKDGGGRVYSGSKAYLNTDRLNLTITAHGGKSGEDGGVGCWVQFSVPRVHNGDNYYPVGEGGAKSVIGLVEKELGENGIRTNLLNSNISRVDTFKNIITEEQFTSYSNLFSLLKANRAIKRDYGTTFLVHNTQQEFCIYSKNEEMLHRGMDVTGYPENTMRFEHRLLNKKKVAGVLGFSLTGELFKGGYAHLKDKELKGWEKSLFSHKVEDIVMLGAGLLETEMLYYKDRLGRNWFQRYLQSRGASELAEKAGVDIVRIALTKVEGADGDRTKVYRAIKQIETAKMELDMVKQVSGGDKTLSTLYRELKTKMLDRG